jgi:hypothetical protein
MEVRDWQSEKAISPIVITLSGIMVFWQPQIRVFVLVSIIALQFSRLSYTVLPSATTMAVSALQPLKAHSPILFTPFPITMEVREEQPQKASSPILVILSGITIEIKDVQLKAPFPILWTLSGIAMAVSSQQPAKALAPILLTPSRIVMAVSS